MNSLIINLRRYSYLFLFSIDKMVGAKNEIIILSYHNICSDKNFYNVTKADFEAQINELIKSYQPITLGDLNDFLNSKKKITKPSFILTFDDGYKGIQSVQGFLKRHNIKPAFFVLSEGLKRNGEEIARGEFLTIADIKNLINSGWEVGCHSATHQTLTKLDNEGLKKEIIGSKKRLETDLLRKIKFFAYPKGHYSNSVIKIVEKNGYDLGLSMDDGLIASSTNRYKIPRIGINGTHSMNEFQALASPSVIKFRKLVKFAAENLYLKNSNPEKGKIVEKKWRILPRI